MTPRQFRRKTRKMVFKRYDLILATMKKTLDAYGLKRMPIKTFEMCVEPSYFTRQEINELDGLIDFARNFNKTLDTIVGFARQNGREIGDNCVSLLEVKQWIDATKAAFIEGQNKPIEKD